MSTLDVAIRLRLQNMLGQGAKAAEKDLKTLQGTAERLGTRSGAAKLGSDIGRVSAHAKLARRDVTDLRTAADRLGSTRAGAQAARDMEQMGRAARSAKRDVEALRKEREALGSGRGRAAGGASDTHGLGPGAGAAVVGMAGRYMAPIGLAYTAKKGFDAAVSFDAAWAEVRKKVDGTPEELERLKKTVLDLSLALGIGRSEMAGLTAEAGAAGVPIADLEKFMMLTGKAAVGWDVSPREASEKLAYIKAGLGLSIAEIEELANKINALGDGSAAKERDILDMFLRVGAAAREAGVDMNATLAILTGVRSGGMEPEVAARWFGQLTATLRTAPQQPKHVAEGLKMLGLTAKQVARGMKTDAIGTILDLFDRLEKSPKAVEAATKIFGAGWWDETMRAKGGLAEIRKQLEMLRDPKNYKGSLDKGLAIQLGTAENHLKKLSEIVSRVGEGLAGWSIEPFNRAVDAMVAGLKDLETRAGWWERWSAEERARLEANGTIGPNGEIKPTVEESPDSWWQQTQKAVTRAVTGDERSMAEQFSDWWWGKAGDKDNDLKAARERGQAAAKAEAQGPEADRIAALIASRERMMAQLGSGNGMGADRLKAGIAAVDEELKKALQSADLGPIARAEMEKYVQSLTAEGERATEAARRIAAELMRILSITATPTIAPTGGGASGGPAPAGGGGGSAAPGKQASVGNTTINQHITGGDPQAVARAAQREQDRAIRAARAGALHDIGAWA